MSLIRVYVKPFDVLGEYLDYIEVTDDVDFNALGDLNQVLDDEEYDVGIFKFSDFTLKLRNEHGRYSDIDVAQSIFRFKRTDSFLKITWQAQDFEPYAGVITAGESIAGNDEVTIFEGILSDEGSQTDIKAQDVNFRVRGIESIFSRVEVPFNDIANDDTIAEILLAILNQTVITSLLTVDAGNIDPAVNVEVDDVSDLENKTVKEALDDLLLISNSVLRIIDGVVYISSRDPSASTVETFYGQASNNGTENIVDLTNVRTGRNKMFNLWTWEDTSLASRNSDSIILNGVSKKEVGFSPITDDISRQAILDALKNEFSNPSQSFDLVTTITEDHLGINLLDKVAVDYPTVLYAAEGSQIPIYGIAVYGEAKYPHGEWSLTISPNDEFKVMGRIVRTKNQLITFKLRKV